jgi:hypothetical protein
MNAKDKFKVGDRVRLLRTQRALSLFPASRSAFEIYGRVIGFGPSSLSVKIIPDHRKTSSGYHMDFWEKVQTEIEPPYDPLQREQMRGEENSA